MNKNFRFAQLMQRLLPISLLLISTWSTDNISLPKSIPVTSS
jgi:hypothetical protein